MPIYEYQCQNQHQFEKLQKISEPPPVECPSCGDTNISKMISSVAFRLKGSGWYETDFKSGGKQNLADQPSQPEKKLKNSTEAGTSTSVAKGTSVADGKKSEAKKTETAEKN